MTDVTEKSLPARIYTWGSDVAPTPLRGGGQLHPHFPSMEIALPHAGHFGVLELLGFAERGLAFLAFLFGFAGLGGAFLFGFAGLGATGAGGDGGASSSAAGGGETVLVGPPFLLPERLYFGRPWSSQQSLTSLAVGWVRLQ